MDTSVGQFNNLSTPVKVGIAVAGGAGLMGIIAALTGGDAKVLAIVAVGLVFVALLLVAYKFVLGWVRKRKAAPLERGILNNSAASPNSISEPARRARLDDLRRSFEGGVEKFRASGKNIYSLPWYALVGEPGSGKTEAIRHCNVGFPPGLQDQLQGAGGTLNMNWWFTNHAIILDTAGRLMFEEVEPGATSEWKEFLGMLSRGRPNCPINGMLLVIPADSLIRDTADAIERKAGKIAQQLDSIQRILGVRFPVFVVITKADLINGFREFFDDLKDPQLQHQILGWSNPSGLDQPFSPELVERHLESVSASLCKRRQGLLIDPVNRDDPNGRRVDEVDALYSFPQSLLKIAPRLRRYLEMVFVAGEWSPKPLFLRGIYFTSSMREGSALDAELAEVLGVPMESLPEGKVFERDRAYFLRDLFINKVFKEKGLVTRASDTKKLQRQRKLAVLVCGFLAVFLLLGVTWFGKSTLDQQIGQQRAYWTVANREYQEDGGRWQLFSNSKPVKYLGNEDIRAESGKIPRGKFHAETYNALQSDIKVPWIFKPLVFFSGELNTKRITAYRDLYERSVLQPLLKEARNKIHTDKDWSDNATAALAQLIRMETYASRNTPVSNLASATDSQINLDPLARYVLGDVDYDLFLKKYGKDLQVSADWLYGKAPGGTWPPQGMAADSDSLQVIAEGVDKFSRYWPRQIEERSARLLAVRNLMDSLDKFRKAEADINDNIKKAPETVAEYKNITDMWTGRYGIIRQTRGEADAAVAILEKGDIWKEGTPLLAVYDNEVTRIEEDAKRAHQSLISQLPEDKAKATAQLDSVRTTLKTALDKVPNLRASAATDPRRAMIPEIDKLYLARGQDLEKKPARRYTIYEQLYARANEQIMAQVPDGPHKFNTVAGELTRIDTEVSERVIKPAEALPSGFAIDKEPVVRVVDSSKAISDFSARWRRMELINLTLKTAPANAQQMEQAVAQAAPGELRYGKIPFTKLADGGVFSPAYHPEAAKAIIRGWIAMKEQLPADPKTRLGSRVLETAKVLEDYDKTRETVKNYLQDYLKYWTKDQSEALIVRIPEWRTFFTFDGSASGWETAAFREMLEINGMVRTALTHIRDEVLDPAQQTAFGQAIASAKELNGDLLKTIKNDYANVAGNWRSLTNNPETARLRVLELTPANLRTDFIVPPGENPPVVSKYIYDFGVEMLRLLGVECKNMATEALVKLKKQSHFPLAKPDDGKVLTIPEVEEAKVLITKISVRSTGTAAGPNPKIREGANVGDAKIDPLLDTLRGLNLAGDDEKFVRQTRALLDALPIDNQHKCTVSWPEKDKMVEFIGSDKLPAFGDSSYSELIPLRAGQARVRTDEGKELGKLTYPGVPLQIRLSPYPQLDANDIFHHFPAETDARRLEAWGGRWAVVRLLWGDNVRRNDKEGGREWYVEVPVDQKRALWVKLEFDKELPGFPKKEEWPEPAK